MLVYALTDVRYARGYKIKQKRLKRRQARYSFRVLTYFRGKYMFLTNTHMIMY